MSSRARVVAIITAVVVGSVLIYGQVAHFSFVDYDDGEYVYDNPHIAGGITPKSIGWALGSSYAANWHPVTWMSHMVDVSLFGLVPTGHHIHNVALHVLSAALLFLLLRRLTAADFRSGVVALVFALHPLNVQSVAWVSERKNVLSTALFLATLMLYVLWVRQRRRSTYIAALVAFSLAIGAKPAVIALPFILAILDVWPLRRRITLIDKVPFAVISFASAVVTWRSQAAWNATVSLDAFPVDQRLLNAATSYGWYVLKTFLPTRLAFFYPHPSSTGTSVALMPAFAALALAVAMGWSAWRTRNTRPYLLFGVLWYAITLFPAAGVVQVGEQARADRYAYIPLIGVFIAAVWGVAELCNYWRLRRQTVMVISAGALLLLGTASYREARVWRDSSSLYRSAIAVNPANWLAWNNLGVVLLDSRPNESLVCFATAVRIKRNYADAYYNAGVSLDRLGRVGEAIAAYRNALELDGRNADGWVNLGNDCVAARRTPEAIAAFQTALRVRPGDPFALAGLARAYAIVGNRAGAREAWEQLVSADPELARRLSTRS